MTRYKVSTHRLSDIRIQQFLDDWRELPEHIPWSVLRCAVVELAELRKELAEAQAVLEKIRQYCSDEGRQCDPYCCREYLLEIEEMAAGAEEERG